MKFRGELRQSRTDIAGAFRKPQFDEVALGELYARHDTAIEGLRRAFVGLGAKVHDALEEKQRSRLADLIEAGPRFWRGGLFRSGWAAALRSTRVGLIESQGLSCGAWHRHDTRLRAARSFMSRTVGPDPRADGRRGWRRSKRVFVGGWMSYDRPQRPRGVQANRRRAGTGDHAHARGKRTIVSWAEIGADDSHQAFSPSECSRGCARCCASAPEAAAAQCRRNIVIDVPARDVRIAGVVVELTGIEFDILVTLARRPGRVVPRDTLLSQAGRDDVTVGDRTVDVHVSHLRRKLGDDPRAPRIIKTVRGVGYVLAKDGEGRLAMTVVTLRPKVTLADTARAGELPGLHHQAHEACFIANSVKTEVRVEPV